MKHHSEYRELAVIVGVLQGGRLVRSDVEPDGDGPPYMGHPVPLKPSDELCDSCRELIDPDEWYGEAWVNVLARQKLKHGGTWCGDCFDSRDQESEPGDANEPDERHCRTFD